MKTFTVGRLRLGTFLASVAVAGCGIIFVPPAFATDCTVAALNTLAVAGVTITSADNIPARPPNPQYCHVKGSVATTGEGAEPSTAGFEADLPAHWNGKFLFQGVGGLAGSFNSSANLADRALFLARGYATAITDTGHLNTDKTWEFISPGQPNTPKLVDYFYRAVHEVTVAAKQVVKGYYNSRSIALLLRRLLEWREDGHARSDALSR